MLTGPSCKRISIYLVGGLANLVEVHMNTHLDSTAQTNHPRSHLTFQDILETVRHEPGQGRLLDQIEKIVRVQQRDRLDVILSQVAEDQLLPVQVLLERELPQRGKSNPA